MQTPLEHKGTHSSGQPKIWATTLETKPQPTYSKHAQHILKFKHRELKDDNKIYNYQLHGTKVRSTTNTEKKNRDRYNLPPLKNFVPEIKYKLFKNKIFSIPNIITMRILTTRPSTGHLISLQEAIYNIFHNMHYKYAILEI